MSRNFGLYLEDILSSVNKIKKYADDLNSEELFNDEMRMDAVVRNLEIIGEAAAKIPPAIKEKHPGVEWKKIVNFRNILAHEYFGIDKEIMWDIIKNKLPKLEKEIQAVFEKET